MPENQREEGFGHDGDPDQLEPEPEKPDTLSAYTDEDLDELARSVERYLSKCSVGQPYEEGQPVWLNEHTSLDDVMDLAGIPEDCDRDEIAKRVRCPSCCVRHDLWDEVGVKSDG
ncbi:MAG TPA: hypothetical protein VNX60_16045, partial [Candidatus Acidoferrum sp.]|nr:hypothetical protein [Candidatus Acidoferrum sp.]